MIAQQVRQRITSSASHYWRQADFADLSAYAVSQALSRLVKAGELERVSKGLYYRPRTTRFGRTRPAASEIQSLPIEQVVFPSGVSAANFLGLSTQNPGHGEFSTPANSLPRKILGNHTRLHTRRPDTWNTLTTTEAALLDVLRTRGKFSEQSPKELQARLLDYLQQEDCFIRLLAVADREPPRVRAMLGALGQELQQSPQQLASLRKSLNPLSRFNFGQLKTLRYANEWQAN
jgi:hypothetical protein